jgi:hypothetical protein
MPAVVSNRRHATGESTYKVVVAINLHEVRVGVGRIVDHSEGAFGHRNYPLRVFGVCSAGVVGWGC